ncbi:type VI immunity family protein [Pseudorhodoferax sp.]|uniref:type VI immunity family protein n=1 Tax=Pseudorhodoferax sp. TaxID=1993553 RepID=UPI0039E56DC7
MLLERLYKGDVLCRVTFGITLYLPQAPTRDEVMRAYSVYRNHCPPDCRHLITTVRTPLYLPLDADDLSHVHRSLSMQDRRHDEGIVIWDGKPAEHWMFWIQGWLDPKLGADTASFCQIQLPEDTDCEVLYGLARGLADELPLLSGHAGYTVQFDARLKNAAFDQIYAWAKRYLGVEVEDLNLTLPLMRDAIKGANWLTLVGHNLWAQLMDHPDRAHELPEGVTYERLQYAGLFRAGVKPVLGDRNRRDFPYLYAVMEKVLRPLKLQHHPEFAGRFGREQATEAWLYRLLDPARW